MKGSSVTRWKMGQFAQSDENMQAFWVGSLWAIHRLFCKWPINKTIVYQMIQQKFEHIIIHFIFCVKMKINKADNVE